MSNMIGNYGTEFLIWSYFGISAEELKDENKVIEVAILRAYRDASSHVLSVYDDKKDDLKKDAIKQIKSFIDNLKSSINMDNLQKVYDKKHREVCNALRFETYDETYNNSHFFPPDSKGNKRNFTYGIAQKWVNMTIKYIYILNPNLEWVKQFKSYFHVPLDSYIYDTINQDLHINVKEALGNKKWSKLDNYDNYMELQKNVRKKTNPQAPIDWENQAWIKAAQKMRDKENEKASQKSSKQ